MELNDILNNSIADLSDKNFDDSTIKDNKVPYVIGEQMYRVYMPKQWEQALAEQKRNLAQLEYTSQEGCITEAQLIEKLKENKIIDIKKLEETKEDLMQELKKYWFALATKSSGEKTKIAEYRVKVQTLQEMLQKLAITISTHLTPCLEKRLEKFYIEYITYLCTEKQEEDKWVKVWKEFKDFQEADSSLANKSVASMTWLLLNRH